MKPKQSTFLWTLILCLWLPAPADSLPKPSASPASQPTPTDDYDSRLLEGWTIHVNRSLSDKEPQLCAKALELLRFQLYQITREVPQPALGKIQSVGIWVELNDPLFPCMCYHPDHDWVVSHGLDSRKTHGVEIANAKKFLDWEHTQPWMVLHELAHAYHHGFLPDGFDNSAVEGAYNNAKEKGLYDAVLRNNSRTERAYAMTNRMEYFAECSEAFFGTNDFYPFVRPELKVHDPRGYAMTKSAWGVEAGTASPEHSATPKRAGDQ